MVRERNPETWFASWASSAPVEAQVDMSVYFNPMEQVGQHSLLRGERKCLSGYEVAWDAGVNLDDCCVGLYLCTDA